MHLAAYRFGKPYESLERNKLVHFMTGEPVAEVSQVGGAIVSRDLRKADNARKAILLFAKQAGGWATIPAMHDN